MNTLVVTDEVDVVSAAFSAEVRAEIARQRKNASIVASAAGLDRSVLSARLRGRSDWRQAEMRAVARVLGLTASELLARAEAALDRDDAFLALAAGAPSPSPSSPSEVA